MFFKQDLNVFNFRLFFIASFFIILFIQFLVLPTITLDRFMWANQALYFETNNEKQYDFLEAYGHPGGTIIEGTILLHNLLGNNYEDALLFFLLIFSSVIIIFIVYLIFLLRKDLFLILINFFLLSFHRFYYYLTPTSYIASLLFVLQAFYSLFLYENREKLRIKDILSFSMLSGLIMATRIDIGLIGTLTFGLFLLPKITMRDFIYSVFFILGSFILFDPYMWYMPFQHISDLAYKFIYHYEFFNYVKLDVASIIDISNLAIISSASFLFLYFYSKKNISLNIRFLFFVLGVSLISYYIFLTSQINAVRYFMPFVLIWEVLFSFLILDLFKYLKNKIPNLFKEIDIFYLKILLVLIMLLINFFIPLI